MAPSLTDADSSVAFSHTNMPHQVPYHERPADSRPDAALGLVSTILVGGAVVMMFFIILSGVTSRSPLSKTYFLSADTSSITGARDRSQWTYFYICSPGNVDCSGPWPAPGFGWAWDAGAANVPDQMVGDHGNTTRYYFLMWRFGWVLHILSLFFAVIAFFAGFPACFGRLGSALAGVSTGVAWLLYSVSTSLITALFVEARNAFSASNRDARIGTYAFGFLWGAWAALFIATVLFCLGARAGKDAATTSVGRTPVWRRKRTQSVRSKRSRKSADLGTTRRVKEDYA